MHICGGPELFLLRVLKVVLDDGAAKETPSDLVVLPLIIQKGLLTNSIKTADLLDKCVEVGDGVLDGGEGEEGDQVATIGCHCHDDKQPPEAGEHPAGVRISSYNELTIVEHQLYTFDLRIVCSSPAVGCWNSCGPLLHQASKADEEAVADVGQAVL